MPEELQTARDSIFDALAAVAAIYDAIGGAANPRIYQEVAQQGDPFPLVIVRALPSADDSQNANGGHIFSNLNFRVTAAIDSRSFAAISTVAHAIFTTLHLKKFPLTAGGGRVLYGRRIRPYQTSYTVDGVTYAESGGDYSLTVS